MIFSILEIPLLSHCWNLLNNKLIMKNIYQKKKFPSKKKLIHLNLSVKKINQNQIKRNCKIFSANKGKNNFDIIFMNKFLISKGNQLRNKIYLYVILKMKILYMIIHFKKKICLKESLTILIIATSIYLSQFHSKSYICMNKIIFHRLNNNKNKNPIK